MIIRIVAILVAIASNVYAEEVTQDEKIYKFYELSGYCSAISSLISFGETHKNPGGYVFQFSFLESEAERLGFASQSALINNCIKIKDARAKIPR